MIQWNRPHAPKSTNRNRINFLSFILITGGLLLTGALFYLSPNIENSDSTSKQSAKVMSPKIKPKQNKTKKYSPKREKTIKKTRTNIPAQQIDEGSKANIRAREAFLKRARMNPETWFHMTNKTYNTKQYFRTSLEQSLNAIFNWQIGEDPPIHPGAIPEWEKKKLVEILLTTKTPDKDDSEQTILNKEMVGLAKQELTKYIEEGGDPDDFIDYYYTELKKAYNRRQVTIELVKETISKESPEKARDFFEAANNKLIEEGMKPIELQNEHMLYLGYTFENGSWK